MNKTTSFPKILPPTLLFVAVLLMIALHLLFPIMQVVPVFWRLLGVLPLGLGLAISYMAEKQFHQAGTTVQPSEVSSCLVTDGLYRFSRNPMYLGMVLILLGVAFLLGSLTPVWVIVFFAGWIHIQFICHEEEMLLTQFGQDWLEYKARVRPWI
jgi:protein-S-isoprenylcysteine O-methyltransferase Ste14